MSDTFKWSSADPEWKADAFPSTSREELIHALREHKGESAEWVFTLAAAMLELDGVRLKESGADHHGWTKLFP